MAHYGGDIVRCQTKSLETQLNMGVCVLDIIGVAILTMLLQSIMDQFIDVLLTVANFPSSHNRETVFLLFQHNEHDDEHNTRT